MKKIIWGLQAGIFYLFTFCISLTPFSLVNRCGAWVGRLIALVVPKRLEIAVENIRLALPYMQAHPLWGSETADARELALETFKNLGRSMIEVCRLYHGRGEDVIAAIEVRGLEHYEAAKAKGKGVLLFSAHCGNWELMALAGSTLLHENLTGVARKQNNPYLNSMIEKIRIKYNSIIIYKQGALKRMLTIFKKGGIVGILADQATFKEDGALIDMLGRKAWALKAPVIVARMSGTPIVPAFMHREDGHHVITIYPEYLLGSDASEAGIALDTQALSRYVENYVITHPTQWYWVHRRWKRAGEPSQ